MMHEKNRQTHNTIDKPRTSKEFDKSSAGRPNKTKQNQTEPNGTRNPTKNHRKVDPAKVTAGSNKNQSQIRQKQQPKTQQNQNQNPARKSVARSNEGGRMPARCRLVSNDKGSSQKTTTTPEHRLKG